jgi:hypothetical protein
MARWTAAGMLQAEQQFLRTIGDSHLATWVIAIEHRHLLLHSQNQADTEARKPVIV